MARVVVVGAGMGGLAVAARLATAGHDVVVCEQSDRVGGKVGTVERDGFVFDTGPSLLTLPAVYRDLFVKTGRPIEDSLDLVEVDPAFRYRFPGLNGVGDGGPVWLDVPNASRARTVAAMDAALGSGAGEDWAGFLDRAHQVWQVTRGPFLESPLEGPRDLLRLARRTSDVRTVAPWSSLRAIGRKHLRDPRLRMLLDRYATYTGSDPRRAPAALAVVPYVEQTFGAWHVSGGIRRLADAVHERALLRGVDVRTGTEVTGVLVEGGRAAGVELADGQRIAADVVVSDADATHLYGDLVQRTVAASARRRLARATPSLSGFVLLLAVRGRTPELAHHTVL
ncbi:MAG TPA: phytoene desaturase family protein, partial [Actinomycetes bacterium]|nr:phytoene desaturase family protein [Actinomycetes bacterium]